jgi:hypothetical protein
VPILKTRTALEFKRNIRLFLNVEAEALLVELGQRLVE